MWPGSDLPPQQPPPQPALPPPPSRPAHEALPRIRPGGGWYALPLVLVALALIGFFAVFAANWSDSEAADGPSARGDARSGIAVELTAGHTYFVYVRTNDPLPTACALSVNGTPDPVPLTREHGWSASEQAGYRYAATFEAPLDGRAELTCEGVAGEVLMTPDDTSYGYLGLAFIGAMVLGGAASVAFVVLAVLRHGSAKRRRAMMPH